MQQNLSHFLTSTHRTYCYLALPPLPSFTHLLLTLSPILLPPSPPPSFPAFLSSFHTAKTNIVCRVAHNRGFHPTLDVQRWYSVNKAALLSYMVCTTFCSERGYAYMCCIYNRAAQKYWKSSHLSFLRWDLLILLPPLTPPNLVPLCEKHNNMYWRFPMYREAQCLG